MLHITAGSCYKPALMRSQAITNGLYHEPVIGSITAGSNGHYGHLLSTRR